MKRHALRLILLLTGLAAVAAEGPKPPAALAQGGLTADEAFAEAKKFFAEKNYAQALETYERFKLDYGSSAEAKTASYNVLYPIAICQIHLNHFREAVPAIKECLEAVPPEPKLKITPAQEQELTFWLGMATLQEKEYPAAREALEKFVALFPPGAEKNPLTVRQYPAAARLSEARSLIGTSWILEEKYREAADYYAALKPTLPPEARGRAVIFQLHALLQLGDDAAAMQVVTDEYPHMTDITQLIAFQILTLKLGSHWLERGEFRKAILCLQRVWPRERLIKHQEERLAALESALQAASSDPYEKILSTRLVGEVKHELENFRKLDSFDTALRFRLANAYLQMKRYREAALIMEKMLSELPPGKLTEQAAINSVRCWSALEDWPHTVAAAKRFAEVFPASPFVPEELTLAAEAHQASLRNDAAAEAFASLAEKFPDSPQAPRARFLRAFALLRAEKNKESAAAFEDFLTRYPKHELADSAAYWLGMASSFDKQFEACREAMANYLTKYPDGQHRGAADFRRAYCLQQMEKYGPAIDELQAYLKKYPGEAENSEARVLLGNALMNEGRMDEGLAVFQQIPATDASHYEEGVFRSAEALKLLEEPEKYRALMQGFVDKNPRSPRVPEALGNLGWYYRQNEQPAKAREIYWQAIKSYGNYAAMRSVDDLFPALARLYRGPEEAAAYLVLLRDMTAEAQNAGQTTLALRLLCARAQALKKSDPAQSRDLLIQAAALADVRDDSPAALVDMGNALIAAGRDAEGEKMLRDALRWNPRALQKDRILAALGDLALQRGNDQAAMDFFKRFERENLGSAIFGPTMLAKAKLHTKRGENEAARQALNALLENTSVRGEQKAEALALLGDLYMSEGNPKKAIPYYQRIYVMHGRWKPWVAKAYVRSGEAFEKISDPDSARRTYSEFLALADFEGFPETAAARDRLAALGGPPAATQ